MRLTFLIFLSLVCNLSFADDALLNNSVYAKGNEHFNNTKWNEAAVLYELALIDHSKEASLYVKAIVSKLLHNDSTDIMPLVVRSEKSGVALDSLFNSSYKLCKSIKRLDIYENILFTIKEHQPWFGRVINSYLLDLYATQKNNVKGITLANDILKYSSNNVKVRKQLMLMLSDIGLNSLAADMAESILALDDDLDTKRFLAAYLLNKGRECSQLGYSNIDISRDSAIIKYYLPAITLYSSDSTLRKNPYVKEAIKEIMLVIDSIDYDRYNVPKITLY